MSKPHYHNQIENQLSQSINIIIFHGTREFKYPIMHTSILSMSQEMSKYSINHTSILFMAHEKSTLFYMGQENIITKSIICQHYSKGGREINFILYVARDYKVLINHITT